MPRLLGCCPRLSVAHWPCAGRDLRVWRLRLGSLSSEWTIGWSYHLSILWFSSRAKCCEISGIWEPRNGFEVSFILHYLFLTENCDGTFFLINNSVAPLRPKDSFSVFFFLKQEPQPVSFKPTEGLSGAAWAWRSLPFCEDFLKSPPIGQVWRSLSPSGGGN